MNLPTTEKTTGAWLARLDKDGLTGLVGNVGRWSTGSLSVSVRILDAHRRFGRVDLEITPLDGAGSQWVERSSVRLEEK